MKYLLILFCAAFLIVSCKDKKAKGWTSAEKKSFTDNCASSAIRQGMDSTKAVNYCGCMQVKMEAKYPDVNEVLKVPMDKIMEMAKECLK